jgi:hypothetical protein
MVSNSIGRRLPNTAWPDLRNSPTPASANISWRQAKAAGRAATYWQQKARARKVPGCGARSPTHKPHPYARRGEFDGCEEVRGVLFIAGCDGAVVLEL